MEFQEKLAFAIFIQLIFTLKLTSAQYCEWGICESWQYCCDENVCCSKNDILFNLTIAVCVFVALIFLCCSIFLISRYICRIGRPMIQVIFGNYTNLPRDRNSSTTNLAATGDVEYDERMYSDPPPPYSEVVQVRK